MRNPALRFWAVEHGLGMLVGLALVHIGRARIRKNPNPIAKHRIARLFLTLALIAIAASVPWPGTANARPLWRG
jgi:hypothetical protein